MKVDSLTFDKKKTYRRKILAKLSVLFGYSKKTPSILALRREIVRKHLEIPKNDLKRFWRKETFLLKRLIDMYPDESFWLKVNFSPVTIKLKFGQKEQKLQEEEEAKQKDFEAQKIREWEEKFDREQKTKEHLENLREQKLKQRELEKIKKFEDLENPSSKINLDLNDLEVDKSRKN